MSARPDYNPVSARPDYLLIADHGVIGDLRTVALVGVDGTINWYCPPHFDSPSVFGAILDAEGGHYRIAPVGECTTKQLYFPDTNVLVTRFLSPGGVAEVQDFMPLGGEGGKLIRRVVCIRGELRFRLECEPRFNYGRDRHEVVVETSGAIFRSPSLSLALGTELPLLGTDTGVVASFELAEGETATFVLEPADEASPHPLSEREPQVLFDETVDYWRDWVSQSTYTGRWREM